MSLACVAFTSRIFCYANFESSSQKYEPRNPAAPAAPIQAVQGQAPQPRRLVVQAAAQPPIAH